MHNESVRSVIYTLIDRAIAQVSNSIHVLLLWLGIGGSVLLITLLHYSTAPGLFELHTVYRYFYFLPIAYAALRFGFWGGLTTSVTTSLLFAPHIFFKWDTFPEESLNDLLVVVVFYGVAIITGITTDRLRRAEAKQAETARKLAASLQRLELQGEELRRAERLSSLGTLAGGLAHEIRNPLGIIRATAQLIAMECGKEASESVQIVEQETARIETFIQELLTFAGSALPEKQPVQLPALLAQIKERLAPVTAAHGIELAIDCAWADSLTTAHTGDKPALPPVLLDARRIEQALLNLCMNSIQALNSPGHICLSVRQVQDESGPQVQLQIRDDGPGLAEDVRPYVFDPFFTTKDSGVGLGLSVVQRTVEDHQGRIWVSSEPGQGCEFTIRIPLETETPQG